MGPARPPKNVIGDISAEASVVVEQLVGRTVAEIERELILRTLHHFEGNRTRASIALGISVRCLRDKIHQLKAHGIDVYAVCLREKSSAENTPDKRKVRD